MELIKFQTNYGLRVIGGRFGNIIRTPSTQEELNCPVSEVSQELIDRANAECKKAIAKHRSDWNLE